jgi:hypothetical protein
MADGYQAQLGPVAPAYSGDSGEAGQTIARGLEQAGDSIDRTIHQLKERDRDTQAADAGVALAQASSFLDEEATNARQTAEPGGAGHTEGVVNKVDGITQANLAAIKDPHVRQVFAERYANLRDQVGTREYAWEAASRVSKLVTDVDTQGSLYANKVQNTPNLGAWHQAIGDIGTTIGSLAVDGDTKTKLVKQQGAKVTEGLGNGLVDTDPHGLIKLIDNGTFNTFLEPEKLASLRNSAEVEIRRLEAAARQKRSQGEADMREYIGVLGKRISAGDYTVTDAELKKGMDGAKLYGLEGPAFDLSDWKDKRDAVKETRTWSNPQWHENINTLSDKAAKGTITTAESLRLRHLQELAPGAIERNNNDQFAAQANAGNPAPPFDPNDPKSVQARISWANATADANKLEIPPYLDNDQLKGLRDRVTKGGAAGEVDVATEIRSTYKDVRVATAAAKQIDPNNKTLQLLVGLDPQAQAYVRHGMDALHANPKLFAGGQGDDVRARTVFNEYSPGIPQELQGPIGEAAKYITANAGQRVHRPSLEGDEFEATYRNAIQRAAGQIGNGNNRTGGLVNWNGRRAWLPPTMGQSEFQQRMSRARPADWKAAGAGAPYYMAPNGKLTPLSDSQLARLGQYELESLSPGIYQPVKDNAHLLDEHGRNWTFDVRKLPH